MLSMKDTGLVSGVPIAKTPLTTVKVLRGFFGGDGQTHNAGEVYACSEREARALIATNKAERAELPKAEPIQAEPTPPEPESVPEPAPRAAIEAPVERDPKATKKTKKIEVQ